MTDSAPLISCVDAWFRYPGTTEAGWAVRGASCSIRAGEQVAIVGANGCGKSTLAKLACGLLIPDKGRVEVKGCDTRNPENLKQVHQWCGYVFQNPDDQLIESIVFDEVAFGPANLGLPITEITMRVHEALARVGLADRAHDEVATLSGGQKQRLAIAGVLALKPQVIVLDEATSMLDIRGQNDLAATLELLKAQGIALISITHAMDEALTADTVIVLDAGQIVAQGAPHDVFEDRALGERVGLDAAHPVALRRALAKEGIALPFCRTVDEAAALLLTQARRGAR